MYNNKNLPNRYLSNDGLKDTRKGNQNGIHIVINHMHTHYTHMSSSYRWTKAVGVGNFF